MNEARCDHGSVAVGAEVFCFAGYGSNGDFLDSIECLNVEKRTLAWELIRIFLLTKRSVPSVSVVNP